MEAYFTEDRARYAWFSIPYNPAGRRSGCAKAGTGDENGSGSWLAQGHRTGITRDYYYGAGSPNCCAATLIR